jgi:hypothetical protein
MSADRTTQPLTRRERRQRERDMKKAATIRPARPDEFGPSVLIPPGSMVIETQLAKGIRHRRLFLPKGVE